MSNTNTSYSISREEGTMSSNDETTHNSEQRQHSVFLKQNGDWSSELGDGTHYEPCEVFFIKGGAIGIETAWGVIVKPIEAWITQHEELEALKASQNNQRSTLQRCKAWLSAIMRRSSDEQ